MEEVKRKITQAERQPTPSGVRHLVEEVNSNSKYSSASEKTDIILKILKTNTVFANVNPLNLSFSLVKDAENAVKAKHYNLAELNVYLVAAIQAGALGLDQVDLTSNTENIVNKIKANFSTGISLHAISNFNNVCDAHQKLIQDGMINVNFENFYRSNDTIAKSLYKKYKDLKEFIKGQLESTRENRERLNSVFSMQYEAATEYQLTFTALQFPDKFKDTCQFVNTGQYGKPDLESLASIHNERKEKEYAWKHYLEIVNKLDTYISAYVHTPVMKEYERDLGIELSTLLYTKRSVLPFNGLYKFVQKFIETHNSNIIDCNDRPIIEHFVINGVNGTSESEIINTTRRILESQSIVNPCKHDASLYTAISKNKLNLANYLNAEGFQLQHSDDSDLIYKLFNENDDETTSKEKEELLIKIYLQNEDELYKLLRDTVDSFINLEIDNLDEWRYMKFMLNLLNKSKKPLTSQEVLTLNQDVIKIKWIIDNTKTGINKNQKDIIIQKCKSLIFEINQKVKQVMQKV